MPLPTHVVFGGFHGEDNFEILAVGSQREALRSVTDALRNDWSDFDQVFIGEIANVQSASRPMPQVELTPVLEPASGPAIVS